MFPCFPPGVHYDSRLSLEYVMNPGKTIQVFFPGRNDLYFQNPQLQPASVKLDSNPFV